MRIQQLFNKESIRRSAGIVLIFTIIEKFLQIGRGVIFARLLGPVNYGIYNLAFFFIPLAAIFVKMGIPSSFSRYIPQYEMKSALKAFLKKTSLLIIINGIIVTLICLSGVKQISKLIYGSFGYSKIIILCSLTLIPYAVFEGMTAAFSGLRVFKLDSILKFSQFLIFTCTGIVFVILYPKTESIILANLISYLVVVSLFGLLFMKYLSSLELQREEIKEDKFYAKIFKFSIWFVIAPVVYTLFNYTDRWMLGYLKDLSHVGIYSVAVNLTGLIFAFGVIAGTVLMPTLSEIWEQGNKDKAVFMLNFSAKINMMFLLTLSVFIFLFRNHIVSLLYGREYMECLQAIGFLLIFWLLHSINWTIGSYAQLIEKTYIGLVCNSIGLIGNIILNYMLIPKYGIKGAAIASTFSSAVILIIIICWLSKEGLKLKFNTVFVCMFPLIFLTNNIFVCVLYLLMVIIFLWTDLIIDRNEREMLYYTVKKAISKYKIVE